jgi:hypothetical protein
MNRSTLKIVVVALLAATAIVVVAGSVDDARTSEGGASSSPAETETQTTVEKTTAGPTEDRNEVLRSTQEDRDCASPAQRPLLWMGVLSGLGLVVGGVYVQRGQMAAIAVAMMVLLLVFFGYTLVGVCIPEKIQPPVNGSAAGPENLTITDFAPGEANGSGSGEGDAAPDLPIAVVAVLAILAIAAVGAVLVTREDGDEDDPFAALEDGDAEQEAEELVDVDEFAAAAGRAADRIEDTDDVDNEIYRAWVEMTTYLDVPHPESSTPGEFVVAAVDAGIDREDVSELTDLFERVRYGHTTATSEREARALDALRRIEAQYGGEDE